MVVMLLTNHLSPPTQSPPENQEKEAVTDPRLLLPSKTPSLVARLMGLDLLPENTSPRTSLSSPRPSSSSSHATPSNPL
ncbi:hypothetical protein L2E82_43218 [Cichorium intybus]|uniref:Uncharacterized protein n=1 Tax=Cichorium intybus TaxID=13427 RepID=A0ACB8ZND0_CICIN|nr:hypothetical protein L2E82_43218 [Cichorium intybus]